MIKSGYYDKRLKFLKTKRKEHQAQVATHQIAVNSLTSEIEVCKKAMNKMSTDLPDDSEGILTVETITNDLSEQYAKLKSEYIEQGLILNDNQKKIKEQSVIIDAQKEELNLLKEQLRETRRIKRKQETLIKNLEKKVTKFLDRESKTKKSHQQIINRLERKINKLNLELVKKDNIEHPIIDYDLLNTHLRDLGCPGIFLTEDEC